MGWSRDPRLNVQSDGDGPKPDISPETIAAPLSTYNG
jgi:hypothetical protein